ncbi:hypothetical protein BKA64DRAFT_584655 [Cadophora sp. MPI-SDFR-AT-0126]|nr:hypothetical protein BKA64DRAFT_584655 [Leotiomycetes sp. MPI-SDFR-AT-0126]
MSKKLLVVFGATGNQGGSVANFVLDDPKLSAQYSVRAITRSALSRKAQALKSKGAEIVEADLDKASTLPAAVAGAHTVFALTTTSLSGNTRNMETAQAKALCSEIMAAGAQYLIWSTLPHAAIISNGKLNVNHFDTKAEIELFIRGQPIKSAFYAPGSFMQNFTNQLMPPRPSPANDGTYVFATLCKPDTQVPLIDASNVGSWVAAILEEPEKFEGKTLAAAQGLYTWTEIAEIVSQATGKTVNYQQVPDDVFRSWMPEGVKDDLTAMYQLYRDYGYYGKSTKEDVEFGIKQAKGHLTNLEEFSKSEKINF